MSRMKIGSFLTRVLPLVLAAMAMTRPAAASADATISFDDLAAGTTVTNQYASSGGPGVVFGPLPGGAGDSLARPLIASAPTQAVSGSQVARIDCPTCNEGLGFVPDTTGTFPVARAHVSVYAGDLGAPVTACVFNHPTPGCASVTLTAFDANGQPVGTPASARVRQGQRFVQLSVSTPSPQIVGFEITASSDDSNTEVAIDNLAFDTAATPPATDFTLTPQTAGLTLVHGQSTADPVTIGRLGGSTGDIQLDAVGLPAGVHAQFSPNPASSQTVLTLTVDPTAPPTAGPSATVTVVGSPLSATAGTVQRSLRLNVQVESVCDGVISGQDLVDALQARCKRIDVADRAKIDVAQLDGNPASTPTAIVHIPDGVTLESDRSATAEGGELYMSRPIEGPDIWKSMLEPGSDTRIRGLRLFGYDPLDTTPRGDGTVGVNIHDVVDVLVDDDEVSGWPDAAIGVGPVQNTPGTARKIRITNNFIHNNVQCGLGYGVIVGTRGYAFIDENVFNYNRHDVAGNGAPGSGYIATLNFVLTSGPTCGGHYNQHFDMHGTGGGSSHVGGIAGSYIEIRSNTIRGDQSYGFLGGKTRLAFDLRGTPVEKAIFADNVVVHPNETVAIKIEGTISLALKQLHTLFVSGNSYGVNTAKDLAAGDFDGDGRADVFQANGTAWYYSPAGSGIWRFLNASTLRLRRLAFGDFNGDGRTDVFTQRGARWLVSYAADSTWRALPAGSNIPIADYRFGDFNGDGKTDVFRANGSRFYVSYGAATSWTPLAASHLKIGDLRLCDFNGDGRTDVFSLANHQWSVSYGGVSPWRRLNRELSSDLGELAFADFDGDGRCDIARAHGRSFQISWGGTSPWHTEPTQFPESFSGTLLANFQGGKRQDILQFAYRGSPLDRFLLSSDFGPFTMWSQREIL
jgi:FG-GAP-like repeat